MSSLMKNIKPEKEQLIDTIARICYYAQSHSADEDAWDRSNLEHFMEHTSFTVACFLSTYFDTGVEWEIVLPVLCGPVLDKGRWYEVVEDLLSEFSDTNPDGFKGLSLGEAEED